MINRYIQINFLQAPALDSVSTLTMGNFLQQQATNDSSVCNLVRGSGSDTPLCDCALGFGPGNNRADLQHGCVPLPSPGSAPSAVHLTYLSSILARVSATLLSSGQPDVVGVHMLARPVLPNETESTMGKDGDGCPTLHEGYPIIDATSSCCTADLLSCEAPTAGCMEPSSWISEVDLEQNQTYVLFSVYQTAAGRACTQGQFLSIDALAASNEGEESLPGGGAPGSDRTIVTVLASSLVSVVLVSAIIGLLLYRRLRQRSKMQAYEIAQLHDTVSRRFGNEVLKDQAKAAQARFNSLQCDRSLVSTSTQLGEGHFGIVLNGKLERKGVEVPVAVKQLKSDIERSDQEEFLLEVWLTSILDHTNIVSVLAVCTKETPFLVALEFMPGGNLLDYIHGTQLEPLPIHPRLEQEDFLSIGDQLSNALVYLEDIGVVHRDLAARNVLVGRSLRESPLKLSDFGMSRNINVGSVSHSTHLPVVPFSLAG